MLLLFLEWFKKTGRRRCQLFSESQNKNKKNKSKKKNCTPK